MTRLGTRETREMHGDFFFFFLCCGFQLRSAENDLFAVLDLNTF